MTEAERPRRSDVPPWLLNALSGIAVATVIALIIALGQGGRQSQVAYLFAVVFGGLILLRHRLPVVMVVATVLTTFAYHALGYPPIGVAVPLVAPLYAAAEGGRTRLAVGAGALVFTTALAVRVGQGESTAYLAGYEGVSNAALIAAAIALGATVRSRRTQAKQQAEITRLTAEQSHRRAEWRLQDERVRLSRDLHDTVGHAMSVIALQAGVAAEAIGRDETISRTAIGHVRDIADRSLDDVRAMVRLLRADADRATSSDLRGVVSMAAVPDLAATARGTGLRTTCRLDAAPDQLPPLVDAAAYRVVQEALTNIVRHAKATEVTVTSELCGGLLRIAISDNGRADGTGLEHGHGLDGMRERVRLLGGSLTAGPRAEGGFLVDARIPVEVPE
ncbi:sensor histidine kinase [Nocardia otitidiscaviarum]|uniref:sensor histidine kinase n=1 Tax=Nocardia otitidiscaviarum TaxID=1823 RepID=UPI001894A9DD|nr:sensor histidine kinase [Nocardia otitidiscaviarum]MBF6178943.1 sensor histidine kinase [Nocardia otitidiscaviarum]